MRLNNLNGWQRLWALTSIIYLIFVVSISVVDFPSPENMWIADDEVLKNLSTKTLELLVKPKNTIVDPWDKRPDVFDQINPDIVVKILSRSLTIPANTKQTDIDYIRKDCNNAVSKIVNQKRIYFVGKMITIWIIPCLLVYALGLSFLWVYRGFRKGGNNA